MFTLLQHIVSWLGAHPTSAGVIVGSIACAEALAFVGLLVPGATLIVGAGALVGMGVLGFWSTLAWCVGGAIVGDGVSYWIGHRYKEWLRTLRPLRMRPELLARGEAFFVSHGGKSVLLARFVGPVRPIVPVIAGMLAMRPARFYFYNILSALAWAPAHLLPGMAFGASLALAGQVAMRLVVLLVVSAVSSWLMVWSARALYRILKPHAANWAGSAMLWARRHRAFAWLVGDLVDPLRPAPRGLLVWFMVLAAGGWLFFGVLEDVVSADPLVYAGQSLHQLLQQLRTPLGDRIMVSVTELGDATVAVPVVAGVLAVLVLLRAWRDAGYWLAAVAFAGLSVEAVKLGLHFPRPAGFSAASYSFPSGHTVMSSVIYGYLAVLVAPSLARGWRWAPYAGAALLVGAIAFSRLYLGAHWLADVVAGIGMGSAWVAVVAIGRARHEDAERRLPWVAATAAAVFLVASVWHVHTAGSRDFERYAVRTRMSEIATRMWWQGGWQALPPFRVDLSGEREQPLNVQWVGSLRSLREILEAAGWREPRALSPHTALRWLMPHPSLRDLPVPPQLHDGHEPVLVVAYREADRVEPATQLLLRLWPTSVTLEPGHGSLWVGTVAHQRLRTLPLISFPQSDDRYNDAATALQSSLIGIKSQLVESEAQTHATDCGRCGLTLLLWTVGNSDASAGQLRDGKLDAARR